jgi:hypothetical protein
MTMRRSKGLDLEPLDYDENLADIQLEEIMGKKYILPDFYSKSGGIAAQVRREHEAALERKNKG